MKFKVKLRLIDSSGKKHKYSLNLEEGSKFTVGRGTPGIGAELNHPTVSTAHCHLTISGGVLHVMDNKSRNGTKLNGKPVSNAAVRVGDMVQVGVCQIEFLEAPNPPIEENPQSTTFIDINELSPEEAAALGKGGSKISDELRAPEPTMAMSKQALSQALAQNDSPPTDEAPDDAAPISSAGQNEEPSRVIDPNAETQSGIQEPNPYAAPTNPYAAPTNPYAAPANPYGGAPAVPDRPGSEPRAEDTLGFRPLDSYGRGREGEYRREDDPRYNPDARSRRRDERDDENEDRRPSRKSSKRSSRERENTHTDTDASVRPRKTARSRSGGMNSHGVVSTLITLFGTATSGSLVSFQKGNYSPFATLIAGVVGTMLVAFLAWMLRKQNEFMEAEGEAKDYYRFLSYSTVALIPASLLTSSAIIFRLAAFIVLGVAFFHFFMVKFRPVAEKFVFLVGSYVCVVTFLGYMVGGQLSGGQVGPQKHPHLTKNQKHTDDDSDREPANDDADDQTPDQPQQPPQPTQPPQPVQQPPQAVNTAPPQPAQTTQSQPPSQPAQQPQQAMNTPPPQPAQKIETPPEKPKNNKPGPDSFAISQLYKAAEHGDVDIVKKLIREKGVNPNTVAENGVTALMLAAYYGHTETARFLLTAEADINLKDRQGTTALMWAVLKGNKDMVLVLVKAGATLTARRNDGDTALDIARLWHYDDVVRILEDPERAKKGFATNGGSSSRKPSSTKRPKKSSGKTKGKTAKKKGKYSATVDDDS